MVTAHLGRGLLAGLAAGLLAGLFALAFGEPVVDRALLLEGGNAFNQVVGRPAQRLGLVVATALYGASVGGAFGLVFAWLRGRMTAGGTAESDWGRSLRLAGALFAGVFFLPFLKYPADPPGLGDPATVGGRTAAYLAAVGLCLLAVFAAWLAARALLARGVVEPVRQAVVGSGLVVFLAVVLPLLPDAPDPGAFPGGLLWEFRLASLGTQAVLWAGLGVVFGALCERAGRKEKRVF